MCVICMLFFLCLQYCGVPFFQISMCDWATLCVRECVCLCVRACVRACVRPCVLLCVWVCARVCVCVFLCVCVGVVCVSGVCVCLYSVRIGDVPLLLRLKRRYLHQICAVLLNGHFIEFTKPLSHSFSVFSLL